MQLQRVQRLCNLAASDENVWLPAVGLEFLINVTSQRDEELPNNEG